MSKKKRRKTSIPRPGKASSHEAGPPKLKASPPEQPLDPPPPLYSEVPAGYSIRPALFWCGVALLLVLMAGTMFYSASLETITMDEGVYLLGGYGQVVLGDFRFNKEHPPLAKWIAGLALWPLDPRLPAEGTRWTIGDLSLGGNFVYQNRVPPERLLLQGRAPFIAATVLFGLVLAIWCRRRFGASAALLALFFFALDPSVIAHGRYAATDALTMIFFFLSCAAWTRFLSTKRWLDLVLAGTMVALAVGSKFSGLVLFGILPLLYLLRWWQAPRGYSARHFVTSVLLLFIVALSLLALLYWPETVRAVQGDLYPLEGMVNHTTRPGKLFAWIGKTFHLPAHSFLRGIYDQMEHNELGHSAFLMGEWALTGFWNYFPAAFAVKTPVALLFGLGACIFLLVRRIRQSGWPLLRNEPYAWLLLLIPPVLFFLLAMKAQINIGHRYLLPIYPFLFVLVGVVLTRHRMTKTILAAGALLVAEHAFVAPHYLAFFNVLAGGPGNGAAILIDSNLDWGQDVKKLARYFEENKTDRRCTVVFGAGASGRYYGIRGHGLPSSDKVNPGSRFDCVAAVSASMLMGMWSNTAETFAWLRELEPVEKVGYSIYIYDLRDFIYRGGPE